MTDEELLASYKEKEQSSLDSLHTLMEDDLTATEQVGYTLIREFRLIRKLLEISILGDTSD